MLGAPASGDRFGKSSEHAKNLEHNSEIQNLANVLLFQEADIEGVLQK